MRMNWAIRGDKEPDKNKQLHILSVKEYEELSEKLTKYKRAFEIFKRLNGEHLPTFLGIGIISKEEYELLEELMNNENNRHN